VLNDYGKIPRPSFIYRNEKRMLYIKRRPEHIMHKFGEAIGISIITFNKLSPNMDILCEIDTNGQLEYFICKIYQFLESDMVHVNDISDEQRFVPISEMTPYKGRRWW